MEVCESVGKSVIFVCEEAPKGLTMHLMTVEKSTKCCVFLLICILRTVHLRQLKEMKSFQLGVLKGG